MTLTVSDMVHLVLYGMEAGIFLKVTVDLLFYGIHSLMGIIKNIIK